MIVHYHIEKEIFHLHWRLPEQWFLYIFTTDGHNSCVSIMAGYTVSVNGR